MKKEKLKLEKNNLIIEGKYQKSDLNPNVNPYFT